MQNFRTIIFLHLLLPLHIIAWDLTTQAEVHSQTMPCIPTQISFIDWLIDWLRLGLAMQFSLVLNSGRSSCLSFLNTGIIGMCHHCCLQVLFKTWGISSRPFCVNSNSKNTSNCHISSTWLHSKQNTKQIVYQLLPNFSRCWWARMYSHHSGLDFTLGRMDSSPTSTDKCSDLFMVLKLGRRDSRFVWLILQSVFPNMFGFCPWRLF